MELENSINEMQINYKGEILIIDEEYYREVNIEAYLFAKMAIGLPVYIKIISNSCLVSTKKRKRLPWLIIKQQLYYTVNLHN